MSEHSNQVMIALLPTVTDWCSQRLPHMTLVYVGEVEKLSPGLKSDLSKAALDLALACSPMTLDVLGVEQFGETSEVDVLKLERAAQLTAMRAAVEEWNGSQFPFSPHATIGPTGESGRPVPDSLTFDRIALSWGDELISYKMV